MIITARLPKVCRQNRVWVDFPVPLLAVNRYAAPSSAMAEP